MANLDLNSKERNDLLQSVSIALETYYDNSNAIPISSHWNIEEIKQYAQQYDFENLDDPHEVMFKVIEGLKKYAVHSPHSGYLGLFNPRPNYIAVLADYIMGVLNPQLAAWSHSPYANEIERFVIQEFGEKYGYPSEKIDGTFATGGAEANLTGVLAAINSRFPNFGKQGWFGATKKPIIYCSTESHHSIVKAAKVVGLGSQSVISIPVKDDLTINTRFLVNQINKDISDGHQPFMVIGTAGTTGAGAIDNLKELSAISKKNNLWLHVDAAYGGAIVVNPKFLEWAEGIENSDSITVDIHKWFSVPMGASLFLTRHPQILHQTFNVSTNYMPEDGDPNQVVDQYIHSIQWSRRFIGLKIYLPLAVYGWKGFDEAISHQVEMGNVLRNLLIENGWEIKNDSKLPIVCFSHPDLENQNGLVAKITERIVESGETWISVYPIQGQQTFRACITNYNTTIDDLKKFVKLFNQSRIEVLQKEITTV